MQLCLPATPLVDPRERPQPQSTEPDKALGVGLPIAAGLLKACDHWIVERVFRAASGDRGIPFVQLQPRRAANVFLRVVDQSLQSLALGREPMAIVNELRVARDESVAQMHHLAIERQLLD